MKLIINPAIFEKFPSTTMGVISAKNINNTEIAEGIESQLRTIEEQIRKKFNTETLSQHPKIDCWRKAYSSFGAKPKENRSSIENLYRMVLQGTELRHISKLVDIYNLISLKHMLPAGGEDTEKMKGNVHLTFAEANEPAVQLLGDKEARQPHAGEVIYKDDISAICRRWNWREAERTKLTEGTKNCVLVIEGLSPITREEVESATLELKTLVQQLCGGTLTHQILDQQHPEITL